MDTLETYLHKGYTIVTETEQFITLKKAKSLSVIEGFLLVVGLPLLLVFGLGLICWILACISYMVKSDETVTLKK